MGTPLLQSGVFPMKFRLNLRLSAASLAALSVAVAVVAAPVAAKEVADVTGSETACASVRPDSIKPFESARSKAPGFSLTCQIMCEPLSG